VSAATPYRPLIWAAPPVYALHELEEYWTALPWLRANQAALPPFMRGVLPSSAAFILVAGALFLLIFTAVAMLIARQPERQVWYSLFGVLVLARLENGLWHIIHAVAFGGYTPGVVTATCIVVPVSLLVLLALTARNKLAVRSLPWMIVAGFAVQLLAFAVLAWPVFNPPMSGGP
jgi:hypothetical protein